MVWFLYGDDAGIRGHLREWNYEEDKTGGVPACKFYEQKQSPLKINLYQESPADIYPQL